MKKIVLGFTLDDVLRDFSSQFKLLYNSQNIYSNTELLTNSDNDIVIECNDIIIDENLDTLKVSDDNELVSIDPYNLSNLFKSKEELNNFIDENIIELFGMNQEVYKDCIRDFNVLSSFLREQNIEPIIISKEFGRSKPSTLYFLSKHVCEADTIKFINNNNDYMNNCDYLITTNYKLINNNVIKVNTDYNRSYNSFLNINSIKDLFIQENIGKILNKSGILTTYDGFNLPYETHHNHD